MLLKDKIILMIDDDNEFVRLVTKTVEKEGGVVVHVDHPSKVLEAVRAKKPDLALLDLNFYPDNIVANAARGEAVLNLRKEHESLRLMPIIVCSSDNLLGTVINVESLGADDFLAKPFNPQVLIHKIQTLLATTKE